MEENEKNLTDILGFYFLIYQKTLNENFIKCWVDGDNNYIFYTKKELLNFIDQTKNFKLKIRMMDTFDDTGIFLWDVENDTIRRLHAAPGNDKGIREYIQDKGNELKKSPQEKVLGDMFEINKDNIKIFI